MLSTRVEYYAYELLLGSIIGNYYELVVCTMHILLVVFIQEEGWRTCNKQ